VLSFLGGLCALELLIFGYGVNPQCDPKLYYPEVPTLNEIAKVSNGRVIGFDCLPATLASSAKLKDVRGYDAVDPARMVAMLLRVADPASVRLSYAQTQFLIPQVISDTNHTLRLPGILNLLSVNYLIFRGAPPPGYLTEFQSPDYWAVKNASALPRASVPKRVETLKTSEQRLNRLASADFDPAEVAFAETELDLPPRCEGTATIVSETPQRVTVTAQMKTAGLLMLADAWDPGWTAKVKGKPLPVLRVNEALRGVVLPSGTATVDFRYEPQSFRRGLKLAAVAILVNVLWAGQILYHRRSGRGQSATIPEQHTE
jgi:hypothetical protein